MGTSSWQLVVGSWWKTRRQAASSCLSTSLLPTTNHQLPTRQQGFTLAGLIVILTIMSIIVAYSVPQQWSLVMKRERDRHTIFVMRQYARAVLGFQQKHQVLPNSMDQLWEARKPRMVRTTASRICPLTGEEDWILVPPNAVTAPQVTPGGGPIGTPNASPTGRDNWNRTWDNTAGNRGSTATQPPIPTPGAGGAGQGSRLNAQLSPPDYKGQFVGVRPNKTGQSILALNGIEEYGEWVFTYQDMQNEITMRNQAIVTSK